jgi:hypothetical protein
VRGLAAHAGARGLTDRDVSRERRGRRVARFSASAARGRESPMRIIVVAFAATGRDLPGRPAGARRHGPRLAGDAGWLAQNR